MAHFCQGKIPKQSMKAAKDLAVLLCLALAGQVYGCDMEKMGVCFQAHSSLDACQVSKQIYSQETEECYQTANCCSLLDATAADSDIVPLRCNVDNCPEGHGQVDADCDTAAASACSSAAAEAVCTATKATLVTLDSLSCYTEAGCCTEYVTFLENLMLPNCEFEYGECPRSIDSTANSSTLLSSSWLLLAMLGVVSWFTH
mmetsp:Transcript_47769/g.95682  ORF Transcript_47769/g.95682 Transcript_47769/m.95682 type:complete len:201 (+) Transcript_47769:2-604(+)